VTDLNPQREQMSDESMVRNLAAQANAIWPQEVPLLQRLGLPDDIRILDAGTGTGEIASRLAKLYPRSTVLGVDVLEHHLELARERHAALAPRVTFECRSIFELALPERSFDLVTCRHVVHSIPYPERVCAELARVTKRGGWLHFIPEDYGMLHFQRAKPDPLEFWYEAATRWSTETNTDLFIGRHLYGVLSGLGFTEIKVDYVVVDTLRVPRETFAAILGAWRDGYTQAVAERSRWSEAEVAAYFGRMIANILDPTQYAAWMVPVVQARVP
jgi:ubiquinone/menaquinone biosynthesis C-methylase UbiE